MKTIEERARDYAPDVDGADYEEVVKDSTIAGYERTAYIVGAKMEHALLTEWHDPKEKLPEKDKNVIVKYVAKDDASSEYYTIGCVYGDNKWDCESLLVVYDDFEIIGWREIHE